MLLCKGSGSLLCSLCVNSRLAIRLVDGAQAVKWPIGKLNETYSLSVGRYNWCFEFQRTPYLYSCHKVETPEPAPGRTF